MSEENRGPLRETLPTPDVESWASSAPKSPSPIVPVAPVRVMTPVGTPAVSLPDTVVARKPLSETAPTVVRPSPLPPQLGDKSDGGLRPTLPPSAAMEAPRENKKTAYGIAGLDRALIASYSQRAAAKPATSPTPTPTPSEPPRFAAQQAKSDPPPPKFVVESDPKDEARLAKTVMPKAGRSMLLRTAIGAVGERILRSEELELRAYLFGRLGDANAVMTGLLQIDDSFDGQARSGRTPRSELYRMARQIAGYLRPPNAPLRARYGVPWERPPSNKPATYGALLSQLRERLTDGDAELLELVYARRLSPVEAAHVLDVAPLDLERELDAARARMYELVPASFRDASGALDLGDIVADTFRVSPEGATPIEEQPVPDPLPNGALIGQRYRIEARIGGGAFAYVYRASDTRVVGHVVALKLLHRPALTPTAREGALRELSLIASAFHPSLVQFKDHGFHEHRLFFVMPWLEGQTLEARLAEGPLAPFDAFVLFESLARAVAALHGAGIRHQDIKPENILLTKLGSGAQGEAALLPVLLDLGVAAHESDSRTAGTPLYFAPEVARRIVAPQGARAVTDKADVYALALTLLHALDPSTRETGPSFEGFISQRAQGRDVVLPAHLKKLAPSFSRWLAADPVARPSAPELASELATLSRDPKRMPRKKDGARAPGPLVALMVVAIAGVSGYAIYALTGDSRAAMSAESARESAEHAAREATLTAQRLRDAEARARRLEEELSRARQSCE